MRRVETAEALRFARRLQALRLAKGWSFSELSRQSGCNGSYLAQIERGEHRITLELAAKVANCLGVELAEMVAPCKGSASHDISTAE